LEKYSYQVNVDYWQGFYHAHIRMLGSLCVTVLCFPNCQNSRKI